MHILSQRMQNNKRVKIVKNSHSVISNVDSYKTKTRQKISHGNRRIGQLN